MRPRSARTVRRSFMTRLWGGGWSLSLRTSSSSSPDLRWMRENPSLEPWQGERLVGRKARRRSSKGGEQALEKERLAAQGQGRRDENESSNPKGGQGAKYL